MDEAGYAGLCHRRRERWSDNIPAQLWAGGYRALNADHRRHRLPCRVGLEAVHRLRDLPACERAQTLSRRRYPEIPSRAARLRQADHNQAPTTPHQWLARSVATPPDVFLARGRCDHAARRLEYDLASARTKFRAG